MDTSTGKAQGDKAIPLAILLTMWLMIMLFGSYYTMSHSPSENPLWAFNRFQLIGFGFTGLFSFLFAIAYLLIKKMALPNKAVFIAIVLGHTIALIFVIL